MNCKKIRNLFLDLTDVFVFNEKYLFYGYKLTIMITYLNYCLDKLYPIISR